MRHVDMSGSGSRAVDEAPSLCAKLARPLELSLPKADLLFLGRRFRGNVLRRFSRPCDRVAPAHKLFVKALAIDATAREEAAVDVGFADHLTGGRSLVHQGLKVAHRGRPTLPDFAVDRAILLAHHRVDAKEHDALAV